MEWYLKLHFHRMGAKMLKIPTKVRAGSKINFHVRAISVIAREVQASSQCQFYPASNNFGREIHRENTSTQ